MDLDMDSIRAIDIWLDANVGQIFKDQPLAQDFARVCKTSEEIGESIAELIIATGQNPRKPQEVEAWKRLLWELADTAFTAILAIQHFTKDTDMTEFVLQKKLAAIRERVPE